MARNLIKALLIMTAFLTITFKNSVAGQAVYQFEPPPESSDADGLEKIGVSPPLGNMSGCGAAAFPFKCIFVPGETRNYVVEVIAQQCSTATAEIRGMRFVTSIRLAKVKAKLPGGECIIAKGGGEFEAGKPIVIYVEIQKSMGTRASGRVAIHKD